MGNSYRALCNMQSPQVSLEQEKPLAPRPHPYTACDSPQPRCVCRPQREGPVVAGAASPSLEVA